MVVSRPWYPLRPLVCRLYASVSDRVTLTWIIPLTRKVWGSDSADYICIR